MCRALTYPNLMAGLRMPHADFNHTPPRNIEVAVALGGGRGGGADVMVDIALLR